MLSNANRTHGHRRTTDTHTEQHMQPNGQNDASCRSEGGNTADCPVTSARQDYGTTRRSIDPPISDGHAVAGGVGPIDWKGLLSIMTERLQRG